MSEPSSSARKSEHPLPVEQSPAEVILNKVVERNLRPAPPPTQKLLWTRGLSHINLNFVAKQGSSKKTSRK